VPNEDEIGQVLLEDGGWIVHENGEGVVLHENGGGAVIHGDREDVK
jgi:hypothetical protein